MYKINLLEEKVQFDIWLRFWKALSIDPMEHCWIKQKRDFCESNECGSSGTEEGFVIGVMKRMASLLEQ